MQGGWEVVGRGRETDYKPAGPSYPELHLRNWCICCSRWRCWLAGTVLCDGLQEPRPGLTARDSGRDANRLRRNYPEISLGATRGINFLKEKENVLSYF